MGKLAALAALLLTIAPARADDTTLTALLAKIDAVAKEVSKLRGLPLKKPIPNDVVDKDELRERIVKQSSDAKSQAEIAAEGLAYARWGEIPRGTDYGALVIDLLTEQIAGYYDPETKKLTISKTAGDDPTWAEMVLSHELDHGLQDQSFDLHKLLDGFDGDAGTARHALVEGDGIALMIEYVISHQKGAHVDWSNPEVASAIDKMMEQSAACSGENCSGAFERAPLAIREHMIFPYRAGFKFVAALRHRQSWAAVDAAYKKPPRSTEQVIHPERYLAGDEPVAVKLDAPPSLADWTVGAQLVWGELGFDVFLRSHGVDTGVAAEAAAGWGGDRTLVLTRPSDADPQHAIGLARLDWDSEADAIEAAEAATRAVDDMVAGATIERTDTRTRWIGFDGQVSWVERKGPAIAIVVGAPPSLADALAKEIWQKAASAGRRR